MVGSWFLDGWCENGRSDKVHGWPGELAEAAQSIEQRSEHNVLTPPVCPSRRFPSCQPAALPERSGLNSRLNRTSFSLGVPRTDCFFVVSSSDLSEHNLYSAFAVLPKNVDTESSAMNRDASELLNSDTHTGTGGRPLSAKESARLRTKQALIASQTVITQGKTSGDGPAEKKLRTEDDS